MSEPIPTPFLEDDLRYDIQPVAREEMRNLRAALTSALQREERLREAAKALLEQADQVGRYNSWLGMCEHLDTKDARELMREALKSKEAQP